MDCVIQNNKNQWQFATFLTVSSLMSGQDD